MLRSEQVQKDYLSSLAKKPEQAEIDEFKDFKQQYESLEEVQEIIKQYPAEEITEGQRQAEESNMRSQHVAERDLQQLSNVLKLVASSNSELRAHTKSLKKQSDARAELLRSGTLKDDDRIEIKHEDIEAADQLKRDRKGLLALLGKYNVDPEWLKEHQLE